MKKVTTILAAILLMAVGVTAQKLSYSSVVRNSDNELVANTNLTVEISIANSNGGAAVYSETHSVTTNQNGLVTLLIGDGTGVTGSMSDVTWQTAYITSKYTLPDGSLVQNTAPVTAVPYALYAENISADALVGAIASLTEEQKAGVLAALGLTGGGGDTPGGDTPGGGDENPCGTMVDANGNVYETVKMGILDNDGVDRGHYRCWTKTNLRATKGFDPSNNYAIIDFYDFLDRFASIPSLSVISFCYSAIFDDLAMFSGSVHYASPADYPLNSYGYLYNFLAAYCVCPPGWHLSTFDEWVDLFQYVSSKDDYSCDGKFAKAIASKVGWRESTVNCAVGNNPASNNATGFSVFPAGANLLNFQAESQSSIPMLSVQPNNTACFWYRDFDSLLGEKAGQVGINNEESNWVMGIAQPIGDNAATVNANHFSVRCVKNY